MIEDAILKLVKEHYASDERALLLSHLGKALKDGGFWPPENDRRALHDVVDNVAGVTVVRDDDAPAFILVTLAGDEARGRDAIDDHKRRLFLRTLPRALLLAFTLDLAKGQVMSVKIDGRVSYQGGPVLEEGFIQVEDEFRLPNLDVRDIKDLNDEQVVELEQKVRGWCQQHDILPESLVRQQSEWARRVREARAAPAPPAAAPHPGNALERLYAAQDPMHVPHLRIPMDLALTLSRLP